MKPEDVPDELVVLSVQVLKRQTFDRTDEQVSRAILAAVLPVHKAMVLADEYDTPTPDGCMCRVHTGQTTIDWQTLTAVPDELVDAFEDASLEAVHASNSKTPYRDSDAHIRGGLAAVLPVLRELVQAETTARITKIGRQRKDRTR